MAGHEPTDHDMALAADASYRNAARLAADASLLYDADRWPTAHAIAVLGLEELGKHMICMQAALAGVAAVPDLQDQVRDHRAKLRAVQGVVAVGWSRDKALIAKAVVHGDALAEYDHRLKLRGLYVEAGPPLQEPDEITRHEAEIVVDALRVALDTLNRLGVSGHAVEAQKRLRIHSRTGSRAEQLVAAGDFEGFLDLVFELLDRER